MLHVVRIETNCGNMEYLKLELNEIKNIKHADLELPFDNGIYTFVGANGCGKSTLMLSMAQLLSNIQLQKLKAGDITDKSFVQFSVGTKKQKWVWSPTKRLLSNGGKLKYNGMYEGSLFYGTRFEDSTNIEQMIQDGKITKDRIADADKRVKEQLSYIIHGDLDHYNTLMRLKNKKVAEDLGIKNRPYFINVGSHLISQYRMSSGECLLISLLHFLYNSIERRSLPVDQKVLVLIDELELALHPIAINRLMEYLQELVEEHTNLVIFLSSHSPEVIRRMKPSSLYKVNNEDGIVSLETNCYPSYLIRDLYSNVSPDYLLLVEDRLAQLVVNKVLSTHCLRNSKLIHCVPVGGANNVLELHKELYSKKVLGTNTKIISILDGDMQGHLTTEQKKLPSLFLPIPSVEKFLYSVIKENSDKKLRKIIKDKYFVVTSLDNIIAEYNKGTLNGNTDNNKNFYNVLCKSLKDIGTSEDTFISGLCDDIMSNVNFIKFADNLKKITEEK